jgi:hypothetical protein
MHHRRMHAMHFIGWLGTRFICAGDLRKRIHPGGDPRHRKRDSTGYGSNHPVGSTLSDLPLAGQVVRGVLENPP